MLNSDNFPPFSLPQETTNFKHQFSDRIADEARLRGILIKKKYIYFKFRNGGFSFSYTIFKLLNMEEMFKINCSTL